MQEGLVEAIFVVAEAGGAPRQVEAVQAIAGSGLEGDRYQQRGGTFSQAAGDGRDLTLIEAEALAALAAEAGIALEPGASRRNVVTRGLSLNDLVGRRFAVGDVECEGKRLCDPCTHLEGLTQPGVLKGLARRGGLRADILRGGSIATGDPVRELPR